MSPVPSHPSLLPRKPIDRLLTPFREFTHSTVSGGLLLMVAIVVALIWANSPWAESYDALWQTRVTVGFGDLALSKALLLWINDGLMAIFFLLVGLEIKREVLVGELASFGRALVPIVAALGGAIVPAVLYLLLNPTGPGVRGWGVPMATDIAFALGVLALLGSRVPFALRVFVAAFAIVDDILAVLVIAIFYSGQLSMAALGVALIAFVALVLANVLGVRRPLPYALLGLVLWVAFLQSGIHATVAGVLLAMTIPARTRLDPDRFLVAAQTSLERFGGHGGSTSRLVPVTEEQHAALWELEEATEGAQSPMQRMEHALQPFVAFLIVPLFALANAGVRIPADPVGALVHPISLGIVLGLVIGKQVGITLATWLVVRSGRATLPTGVTWRQIHGVSLLGGIGFTMSLFIAELAFAQDAASLALAKIGILAASVVGGVGGYLLLRRTLPRSTEAAEG
jgi:Na+:H+ antiporter, NhaA family